ncbi:MAG: lipase [Flaviaesturariibacter sp.]|nr:lipase [Flaviaesturariibacter sp.]
MEKKQKFSGKQAWLIYSSAALLAVAISSCDNNESATTSTTTDSNTVQPLTAEEMAENKALKPVGPKPDWAPNMKDEMAVVIEKLASFKAPPIETLTAAQARQQPTPATAVAGVMADHKIVPPPPMVDTMAKDLGGIPARIYTPKSGTAPYPVIVYYHGGGWVIADINTYDASARVLAEKTGAVVVSVEYRKGPENKFPAAHNDAFAAYQWVLNNATTIHVDPKRIAVAGESAGGNLACNVSIMARDKGIQMPLYQVLVYPVANNDMNSESYTKYAAAKPLNKPMMEWFAKNYLPSMAAAADPRISLVRANLKGLPPTTIIGAEIDPLMTEGKLLADKLKEAGVIVNYKLYDGVTHEFFGMAAVVPQAKDAQGVAASDLKGALK